MPAVLGRSPPRRRRPEPAPRDRPRYNRPDRFPAPRFARRADGIRAGSPDVRSTRLARAPASVRVRRRLAGRGRRSSGSWRRRCPQAGSADETSFLPRDAESLAAREVIAAGLPQRLRAVGRADRLLAAGRPDRRGPGRHRGLARLVRGHRPARRASSRYVTAEGSPSLASMFRSSDDVVELAQVDLDTPSFLPRTNAADRRDPGASGRSGRPAGGLAAQVTGQAGIGRDYLQAIRGRHRPDDAGHDRAGRPRPAAHLPRPAGGAGAADHDRLGVPGGARRPRLPGPGRLAALVGPGLVHRRARLRRGHGLHDLPRSRASARSWAGTTTTRRCGSRSAASARSSPPRRRR